MAYLRIFSGGSPAEQPELSFEKCSIGRAKVYAKYNSQTRAPSYSSVQYEAALIICFNLLDTA